MEKKIQGTRCRLNALGKGRYRDNKERQGTIMRYALNKTCYVIVWEGRKTGETVHVDLIEKL